MAEVVLKLGIQKLSTFLSEQGTLLGVLRQEVQLISDEFGHMKAFLEKMANFNQENDDPQLGEWIRQVRDVSYDTQDIIDEFLFVVARHRLPGLLGSMRWTFESTKNLPARHRLASKLQSVKTRISNMSEARLRYESHYARILSQFTGRIAANTARRNDDALLVEEAQLVGIDKPKQHLISQLLGDGDSQLKAIAVRGMGGLGKTTLARKIYEDVAVKSHFLIRAWVSVSQNCEIQGLLNKLIRQLVQQFNEQIPPDMDSMDSHELKAIVKDFLHRGRYAIVFDDVWDTEFWDEMKFVLPENSYGGNRVVFTTRIVGVAAASTTESQGYVYSMKFLSFEDSWTLLCKKIFKGEHCPADLKDVAESIVDKCGGLPLGILAIGGLLASKGPSTKREWELIRDGLGDEIEGIGKLGQLKRILSLSYNDLPSTLKACLLYTSIFYSGQDIRGGYLVHLLVAEGFVAPKGAHTAEESAWDCLKELANRSLIQPVEMGYNGQFRIINIHDLLRDFIALMSKEQNMVTSVSSAQHISGGWHPEKVVRRLVFDNSLLEIPSIESHRYMDTCRCIFSFERKKAPSKAILAKLLCSNILTVVSLYRVDLEDIPGQIFNLLQLKFLGVSGKGIKTVPKSIQRLQNLQCLYLLDTRLKELPVEIGKLHKLGHLQVEFPVANNSGLGHRGFNAPRGMGDLVELQTLAYVDAAGMMSEIGKLTKLRKLCITNVRKEDGEELCSSLNKLKSLQELVVASSFEADEVVSFNLNHPIHASSLQSLFILELFGCLENIPPWIRNLRGLGVITLSLSNLAEDPLETLQHLPNLLKILLVTDAYQGEFLCFKAGCYLKLKYLRLKCMKGLRSVRIEKGAMPGINKLYMEGLPLLEELPVGIEHLSQLQELHLWDMNPQLIEKLESSADSEEDGENYQKIAHVPLVNIGHVIEGRLVHHRLPRKKKVDVKKEYQAEETQNAHGVSLEGIGRGFGTLLIAVAIFCVLLAIILSFTSFSSRSVIAS